MTYNAKVYVDRLLEAYNQNNEDDAAFETILAEQREAQKKYIEDATDMDEKLKRYKEVVSQYEDITRLYLLPANVTS